MSYRLFEVFGIELEYMVVSRDQLHVKPIVDELFKEERGDHFRYSER